MKGANVVNEMMTGADLITYIVQNELFNEPIMRDNGLIIGFVSVDEVAARMNVGYYTVMTWVGHYKIPTIELGGKICFPAKYEAMLKEKLDGNK